MIKIKLQLFGGMTSGKGTKTTNVKANIPAASEEEKTLLSNQMNYANDTYNNASVLSDAEMNAINNNSVNADWQNLYDTAQSQTAANQTQAQGLANGVLPGQYSTNRQAALNADLQGTVGNLLSGLGNRGILNSTTTNSALNSISQNAANTLAANYSSDMNTASNLLNNSQNLTNTGLNNATSAVQGSLIQPTTYSALSLANDAPTDSLLTGLRNSRYSVASPAQTIVQQGNGGLWTAAANAAKAYYMGGA